MDFRRRRRGGRPAELGFLAVPETGGRDQQWTGQVTIAPGATVTILDLSLEDRETLFILDVSTSSTAPVLVTTTRRYDVGFKDLSAHVGPAGGQPIPILGGCKIVVENLAPAVAAQIRWSCLRGTRADLRAPPIQTSITVSDDGGLVGAWTDVGWLRPDRCVVDVGSTGAVDLQWINAAGATVIGPFAHSGLLTYGHAPLCKLQARHPGGVVSDRIVTATWRMGGG